MSSAEDQARETIRKLVDKYASMSSQERKSMTEASVVHQFLDPFLEALGWPVKDPSHYKYEPNMQAGRPDMILIPEKGGVIFVEAKRFGTIEDFEQARKTNVLAPGQLSLPGMATDRTKEEQQAINYAFENNGTWAILTNFEKLRLFNARRDWLVLSFSTPGAFLEQFDLLWQLSYENVCKGSLDALSNQRYREDVDIDYLNFINEWREKLAKDIISRPESNKWAFASDGRANLVALRSVVQRILDRLVVVRFAEDHLVAPAGTLYSLYELRNSNPYTYTLGQMVRQLYRRFDEDHNSALFAPDLTDEAVLSDEVLSGLIQKLYEARYRAMSADIMGNTYEQYLGKTLAQKNGDLITVDNLETRKKQGSYYTSPAIVRYLVDNSLGRYLYGTANGHPDGQLAHNEKPKIASEISELRVLDPACGSGSFLIYAYEVLANFYRREIRRLEEEREKLRQELVKKGVTKPFDLKIELTPLTTELDRLQDYPRIILETHLYGVDLDPQAAEIATVNLIMRAMADQHRMEKRLPLILNQNVKVGNSLIGAGASDSRYSDHASDLAEVRRLRLQLANKTGTSDHERILKDIEQAAGTVNSALDKGLSEHCEDVRLHRPFNWAVEFPEVFLDERGKHREDSAGFNVVVGNPPWEILKPDLREFYAQFAPEIESKLTRSQAERRIAELNNEDPARQAAWEAQKAKIEEAAAYLHSSSDYVHQGQGDTATHKLFLERGYGLLRHGGRLGYVIPSGIYTDLGTQQLRRMLLNEGHIQYLCSFSNEKFFFPQVHHSYKFTLLGVQRGVQSDGFWAAFRFNPRVAVAPKELAAFLNNPANLVYVRHESLKRFSPRSLSVMEFQTKRDYDVTERIYGDWPLIEESIEGKWNIRFTTEFHMTSDRGLFKESPTGVPLYEGKMLNQFDIDFAQPRFWLTKADIRYKHARPGIRAIARTTDKRTLIAAMLPPGVGAGNSIITVVEDLSFAEAMFLLAVLNSFVLDFVLRLKIAANVNMFYLYQLPVPRLTRGNPYFEAVMSRVARLTCTTPEFAEVWQEVMNETWDKSKGATAEAERQILRDEIDAFVAHLYGLSHDEFAHILNAFPLVFPQSDAVKARKNALFAIFDNFAESVAAWNRE